MPRWLWFAPLAGLTLLLALGTYRIGWLTASLTETDVIALYAQRYLADATLDGREASVSDCVAVPGPAPEVWIVVRCGGGEKPAHTFPVDRTGRLLEAADGTGGHFGVRPKT